MANFEVFEGNALDILSEIPDEFFHCCVTSPPYWKKRDYGHPDQLGMELEPMQFVRNLADIFDQVKRVLKSTGSLWVNIDDTFLERELLGIPWMLAFELKNRGWHLRGDGIWWKTNSAPEGAKNRMSRAHEYMFHFTKMPTGYYFDMDSVRDPHTNPWAIDCLEKFAKNPVKRPANFFSKKERHEKGHKGMSRAEFGALMNPLGKHKRDVLTDTRYYRLKPNLTPDQIKFVLTELSNELDTGRGGDTGASA